MKFYQASFKLGNPLGTRRFCDVESMSQRRNITSLIPRNVNKPISIQLCRLWTSDTNVGIKMCEITGSFVRPNPSILEITDDLFCLLTKHLTGVLV